MLAQGNDFIQEAAQTMYQLSAEEAIRQQCEAREDAERVFDGLVESRDKYKAMAEAALEQAKTAQEEAKAAQDEAKTAKDEVKAAKARADAAEARLNTLEEELKRMREEMEALKQRP